MHRHVYGAHIQYKALFPPGFHRYISVNHDETCVYFVLTFVCLLVASSDISVHEIDEFFKLQHSIFWKIENMFK